MRRFASLAVGAAAFGIYATLAPPVSGPGDSAEFTLVLATNGVAHPTGYPLYTLLGHLFCRGLHAAGLAWPLAANLWSALGAACAVGFLHALGARLIPDRPDGSAWGRALAPIAPVALFALQPILLMEATVAEVNTWSLAWTCATALLLARTIEGLGRNSGPAARFPFRDAIGWGLLCGVGAAHHVSSILIAAPFTAALGVALARRQSLRVSHLAGAIAGFVAPLASYGVIAWRAWHPAAVQWPGLAPSWASVLAHVTGEQYRVYLGHFLPALDQQVLLARVGYPFLFSGFALLVTGVLLAERGRRALAWGLLGGALATSLFAFRYGVPDPAPYFLPAMALGAAAASAIVARIGSVLRPKPALLIAAAAVAAATVLTIGAGWVRGGWIERQSIVVYDSMIESMWSVIPADSSIVIWRDDRDFLLRERQILRGEKRAVTVLNPESLLLDPERERFRSRFGFDPVEGLPIPNLSPGSPDADRIRAMFFGFLVRQLNARSHLPVIVFDPGVPIVRRLNKPAP